MHTKGVISEIRPALVTCTRISSTYRTPKVRNFPPDSGLVRPRSKSQLSVLISIAPVAAQCGYTSHVLRHIQDRRGIWEKFGFGFARVNQGDV